MVTKTAHRYQRGQYPTRVLAKIRSKSLINQKVGTVKVHLFVAAAWNAMVAEILRERHVMVYASGPAGGYRSLSLERWMHTHYRWLWPILAAVGYSNHNEADCVDAYSFAGLPPAYVTAKLKKFGFTRPIRSESWHLQHNRSDRWYIPKAKPTDTRKVYLITASRRWFLAGAVSGVPYLDSTTSRAKAVIWIAGHGRGTPYTTDKATIHEKAGK